jgi:DNA processing protein
LRGRRAPTLQSWIGFNLVKGIGPAKVRRLLDFFGNIDTAWAAPIDALRDAGLDRRSIEALVEVRNGPLLEQALARIEKAGVQVLHWEHPDYPRNLLNIAAPPPVLYVLGQLGPADEWAVGLVGTRHPSPYGKEVARELSTGLAASGVTVVSGLARGIDAVAHKAALDAGGRTIAVLGSGLDNIYPAEHRQLVEAISRAGAVVSDYALGTRPDAANFPPRNRIISGLSKGVVIVEAGEGSGALITADFAAEQGRDVFAVPGSIFNQNARGTNRLLKQGARLVTGVSDILEELNFAMVAEQQAARTLLPVDATEQQILAKLSADPLHIDDLGAQVNMPMSQVSGTLALMELKGLVRQVGGMNYVVAKDAKGNYSVE